jgi:hypothetical protein
MCICFILKCIRKEISRRHKIRAIHKLEAIIGESFYWEESISHITFENDTIL